MGEAEMNINIMSFKRAVAITTIVGLQYATLINTTFAQTLNIPNVPLNTLVSVDPNIVLILDDSGSMQFEVMPDDQIQRQTYYLYPPNAKVYGDGGVYNNNIPAFDITNNPYGALVRSPAINTIYYDPSITYTPWTRADGSLFPNANPTCAPNNPVPADGTNPGCRNLTVQTSETANWVRCTGVNNCTTNNRSETFWPAVYFRFNGGNRWNVSSYTRIEIRPTIASYSGDGREKRTDCNNGVCTYQQEIQNFANWYTYYRSRILATRAGTGRAFANLRNDVRVGFAAINKESSSVDGVNHYAMIAGVRQFTGTDRNAFFDRVYQHPIPRQATPLRKALDAVGQYYSRSDDRGPWSSTPGLIGGTETSCRRSYAILMTDGYWNKGEADTAAARANTDGTSGPTITGPGGRSFTYVAKSPFRDNYSNSLSDIAMYYWKNDLRPDLTNNLTPTKNNPAFWQHMVTMGITLGISGLTISPDDAFAAIDTGANINWPDPQTSNNAGDANIDARIDDLLHATVNSRGSFVSAQSPEELERAFRAALNEIANRNTSNAGVISNTRRFNDFALFFKVEYDSSDWKGDLRAFRPNIGDGLGREVWTASRQLPSPAERNIYTRTSTGAGVSFRWNALPSAERSLVGSEAILNYIRGDQTIEQSRGGPFRNRTSLLGDIVHSEPVYYPHSDGGVVYVGANDGMLHAFDARTGRELFAYIPRALLNSLSELTNPNYAHRFFVDGPIAIAPRLLNRSGNNVLVMAASTGRGARGLFGLNIRNPRSFGTNDVLWERIADDDDMGHIIGPAVFATVEGTGGSRRTVLITGNGVNSPNGKAVLFIIDPVTGSTIRKIDTGIDAGNGLSPPALLDRDGDGLIETVYAGDLKGNLWKFDLRGGNPASWKVALGTPATPLPMFTARSPGVAGLPQSITAAPTWAIAPANAGAIAGKIFVFFGTGSYLQVSDPTNTQIQSLYGVMDDPTQTTPLTRAQLAIRPGPVNSTLSGQNVRVFGAPLTEEQKSAQIATYKGWVIDFDTTAGERFVFSPEIKYSQKMLLEARSLIPGTDPCTPSASGYANRVDPFWGTNLDFGYVDVNKDNNFNNDTLTVNGQARFANSTATGNPFGTDAALTVPADQLDPNNGGGPIGGGGGNPPPERLRAGSCASLIVQVNASGERTRTVNFSCRTAWREVLQ
jgi:type IV pilus assembly protein PilY1